MNMPDEDRLELLERQLADKIIARVRPALFKLYAATGLAVIAALGFVSWDIVSEIKAEIKSEVTDTINIELADKRKEIQERASETQFLARRANKVLDRLDKQLDEFQPQAEQLDETIEKVKTLNITSQDLIATYTKDVGPLADSVKKLSNQLQELALQVDQINTIPASPAQEPGNSNETATQQRSLAIQSVISDTKAVEKTLEDAGKKPTVFFQFALGNRDDARAIASALEKFGYVIPGEDREKAAYGRHEVRYFHEDDKIAAENFARDANKALEDLEYQLDSSKMVTAKSLTSYRGKKPRKGVLEFWLEIPHREDVLSTE